MHLMRPRTDTGSLIELLSAPEGSFPWATGMRRKIQTCCREAYPDHEYISHCLRLLLRTGAWRLLPNSREESFPTFVRFCRGRTPYGLGLKRRELEMLLAD
jgi:hypothetical protein